MTSDILYTQIYSIKIIITIRRQFNVLVKTTEAQKYIKPNKLQQYT